MGTSGKRKARLEDTEAVVGDTAPGAPSSLWLWGLQAQPGRAAPNVPPWSWPATWVHRESHGWQEEGWV